MSGFTGLAAGIHAAAVLALGEHAVFTPAKSSAGHDPIPLRGIWNGAAELIDVGNEARMSGTAPILDIRLSDLPATPEDGDRVEVLGRNFRVIDAQPDGHGMVRLILKERG